MRKELILDLRYLYQVMLERLLDYRIKQWCTNRAHGATSYYYRSCLIYYIFEMGSGVEEVVPDLDCAISRV